MRLHWKKRKAQAERTRTGTFKYVPFDDIADHHERGWMVVGDLGARHGAWACLMWCCDCGEGQ
jgi:hypothetical protein